MADVPTDGTRSASGLDHRTMTGSSVRDSQPWLHFNIHDLVRLRTNVQLTTVPAHFRVDRLAPNFELEMVDALDGFLPKEARRVIGFTTYETGEEGLYYECDVPVFSLIGTAARWRFFVRGLAGDNARVVTSLPFYEFRPVRFKARQLLSKLALLIVSIKLIRSGYAGCHATCLAREDDAILFFAFSGTGKSTIAASLINAGFTFLSDDFAIIDPDGHVYCYPDWHAPRTSRMGVPLSRYLRRKPPFLFRQHGFPVRERAKVGSIILLEGGPDGVEELDRDEALRRVMLVNMAEVTKLWNSPLSPILNQYAYFYPKLDFDDLMARYRSCVASFIGGAERYLAVRSRDPTFGNLLALLSSERV